MGANDLLEARLFSGLTVQEISRLTGRHATTWRRMEKGQIKLDLACLLVASYLSGELGMAFPAWEGWLIARDGLLYAPNLTRGFSSLDILRLPWLLQLSAELKAEGHRQLYRIK